MSKVISYSLYNCRRMDMLNSVVNCFLAQKIYPDWVLRFHLDETVPSNIVSILSTFDNVEIFDCNSSIEDAKKMMWRFLPASDPDVDVFISRDADSWLSYREKVCVDAFLESDKSLHIIRDHCYHVHPIMGGMWGAKNGLISNIDKLMQQWYREVPIHVPYDQAFLARVIYPVHVNNSMVHVAEQYNIHGQRDNYHDDGSIPMPESKKTEFENFSFPEANEINKFQCIHCKNYHGEFVGGILEKLPDKTENFLKEYFKSKNIEYLF